MIRILRSTALVLGLFALAGSDPAALAAAKPKFESKLVTAGTPGHAVDVDVDVTGAKKLYLVVTDGGNGFACDWADWAEPRLIGPKGDVKKLTELKWKSARTDWGQVRAGRNADGGPLRIAGKPVEYGIGTHANSIIEFDLPEGYVRFKARAGLDNGGTDQNGGQSTSVRFLVYTEQPPATIARAGGSSADLGNRAPEDALAGLEVADGLEATLFAAEPMLLNPTNIDIDARGRVWVCEVVNYRHFANKDKPAREEGDRILILEDTNGDGKADKRTVFYQGRDIDSAHGVCVLGTPDGTKTRAIVSVGEHVYIFHDENGDDRADRKEVLFSGISGTQHDHGIHAFVFGPDGKLYFNFGNVGRQIKDKHGKPIVDRAGNTVTANRQPYQEGMVFRCNLDGSEFETLGWNFRNNWEVCVDSFGTLWQSDNDDDGNRGVRINYVMEFGNFGYKDELTGAGWQTPRTGMHAEIPKRHWHLNDPGVVPNLLHTGAGSPTGICVYEGRLLPKVFHDQIIHCDAGPNIVRAYPVEKDGAGYKASVVNILEGTGDKWFRPSDVCVAPDGSLIVADWYDPGVGGHRMGDVDRGRLFRIAPPKTPYKVPQYDYSTPEGAIEALKSPNLAVRYLAWTALNGMQAKAEPALAKLFNDRDANPRYRARALWLLGRMKKQSDKYIQSAFKDHDPDICVTALRVARSAGKDLIELLNPANDELLLHESPQVRRECAIALRQLFASEARGTVTRRFAYYSWALLASQHDGKDRWYVEALGIAAEPDWDGCMAAWLLGVATEKDWMTPANRDIVWRSRSATTPDLLAMLVADPSTPRGELPRLLRAFDFQKAYEKKEHALIGLAFATSFKDRARQNLVATEALKRLRSLDLGKNPQYKAALDRVLDGCRGTEQFVELAGKFNLKELYPELLALAREKPDEQIGVAAIRMLLGKGQQELIETALDGEDAEPAVATIQALANSGDGRAQAILRPVMNDRKRATDLRREAARGVARTRNGALELLTLAETKKLDPALKDAVAAALHTAQWNDVKQRAGKLFPLPPTRNDKPLPAMAELVKRKGDPIKGRIVFNTTGTCAKCHTVNGFGKEVGPDLSEIGKKLSRQALYESILYPSAGISHNYETYVLLLDSGNTVEGLLTSRTPQEISIKSNDGIVRTFKTSEVEEVVKQNVSLMPADLQKTMTAEELVDVVEYMTTLQKALAQEERSR